MTEESDKEFRKKQRKGMWIALVTSMLLIIFLTTYYLSQDANAQSGQSFFEIIENPNSCERIRIFGEKAWLPFRLVISHPSTDETLSHVSAVDKTKESRDLITTSEKLDFLTEEVNTWTIGYQINYPINQIDPASGKDTERTYVIEYASEQKPTQKETRKMFGNSICLIFEITTEVPPVFPVIDDLLTDVGVKSLQEMQFVVPKINTLDQTLGRNTFVIVVFIIVVLGLIAYMYFKAKEFGETRLQTQRQILQSTKNSNEQTEQAKKAVEYIHKELIPSIDDKIENMMDKFEMEKNTILLDIKSALGMNKLKDGEKKGEKEKIYEDDGLEITKTDLDAITNPEEFLEQEKLIDESEKDHGITFADIPDIEKIQESVRPVTLKEKITKPIKETFKKQIDFTTKLPEKFKKSQSRFMKTNTGKTQIDFALDQEVKPIKLKKLYTQNPNKVNESLYKQYWNLTQQYPNVPEIRKRCQILNDILTEYARSFEKKRQAESEINGNKEKK